MMTKKEEAAYAMGQRMVWESLARLAVRELVGEDAQVASLVSERAAAVAALRRVCAEYGDNDWPDSLHLADVIEKHLERHLDDAEAVD